MNEDNEKVVAYVTAGLIEYAKIKPSVVKMWLFGSRIRGKAADCEHCHGTRCFGAGFPSRCLTESGKVPSKFLKLIC
jgi:hypothetical protein